MLKKLLENELGQHVSNSEFAAVMEMTTDDIKFNNIKFSKKTSPAQMLAIAKISYTVIKR